MKKIISLFAVLSVLISCFCGLCVRAAEEPTIYYSVDRSKWYELPIADFTGETTAKFAVGGEKTVKVFRQKGSSAIDISDKAQFVYMFVEAPSGAECSIYTTIDVASDQRPWGDLVDGGEWAWNKESNYAKNPVKLTNDKDKGDGPKTAVAIPLRLGRVDVYVSCTSGSDETVYKVSINGLWTAAANSPKLSDKNSDFRVYARDAAGYPILMHGASLANDNQTYLFTYSKYRVANSPMNWNEKNMWVGANFSKWLEGSSYVMMPGQGLADLHSKYNSVSQKFFDLSTDKSFSSENGEIKGSYGDDYIGEVVVLMPRRANKDSEYYKGEWECVNSGITPKDGGSAFSPLSKPRNYNDYTDNFDDGGIGDNSSKYYGVAIKWVNSNGYREDSPGIGGTLSSSNYSDYAELNYAYRKKFKAGETVSVYSPGNIEGDDESYGLIIPVIKYYPADETADIKDVEAKYIESGDGIPSGGAVAVNVTTLIGNYVHGRKIIATYALYDSNGELTDVESKTQEATTTNDEFIFACSKDRAKFLNVIFTNDEGTVISNKKVSINP